MSEHWRGMLQRMEIGLPTFDYHPDPVSTGSFVRAEHLCPRCGEVRDYVYAGPVYSVEEIESLCPWCVADGSAAHAFEADFTTVDAAPSNVPESVIDVILHRTPGFGGWQQERWLFHCGDGAQFLGRVGFEDVAALPGVLDVLAADGWRQDDLRLMHPDGDFTGYLFTCRHCRAMLAYADHS